MGIKDTLLEFMREEAYRPMDIQELVSVFDINPDEYRAFKKTLKTMEKEGLIFRTKKDKFALLNSRSRGRKGCFYSKFFYKWSYEWR